MGTNVFGFKHSVKKKSIPLLHFLILKNTKKPGLEVWYYVCSRMVNIQSTKLLPLYTVQREQSPHLIFCSSLAVSHVKGFQFLLSQLDWQKNLLYMMQNSAYFTDCLEDPTIYDLRSQAFIDKCQSLNIKIL